MWCCLRVRLQYKVQFTAVYLASSSSFDTEGLSMLGASGVLRLGVSAVGLGEYFGKLRSAVGLDRDFCIQEALSCKPRHLMS